MNWRSVLLFVLFLMPSVSFSQSWSFQGVCYPSEVEFIEAFKANPIPSQMINGVLHTYKFNAINPSTGWTSGTYISYSIIDMQGGGLPETRPTGYFYPMPCTINPQSPQWYAQQQLVAISAVASAVSANSSTETQLLASVNQLNSTVSSVVAAKQMLVKDVMSLASVVIIAVGMILGVLGFLFGKWRW